jgi:Na+-driven multidrug efflux pump
MSTIQVGSPVRWRMRPRTRKGVLVAHIVAAGAWIGLDVMLGVLVFTPLFTSDPAVAALCYQVLPLMLWPILLSGLTCLVTGVVLGAGTHHGLVRYWWVLVKLILNVVLTLLVLVLLSPGLDEAAAVGRQLAAGATVSADLSNLVFPPIVSGTSLVVATVLAVYKPWGRVRPTR